MKDSYFVHDVDCNKSDMGMILEVKFSHGSNPSWSEDIPVLHSTVRFKHGLGYIRGSTSNYSRSALLPYIHKKYTR